MKTNATLIALLLCVASGVTQNLIISGAPQKLTEPQRRAKHNYFMQFMRQPTAGGSFSYAIHNKNLMTNGAFEAVDVKQGEWKTIRNLQGWQFNTTQVGFGRSLNSLWDATTKVARLDSGSNIEMRIPLQLPSGSYYAAFDWSPTQNKLLRSSQIQLRYNGILFITYRSFWNQIRTQSMGFILEAKDVLTFTGAGEADGIGALLGNVRIYTSPNKYIRSRTLTYDRYNFATVDSYSQQNLIANSSKLEAFSFGSYLNASEVSQPNVQRRISVPTIWDWYLLQFDFAPREGQDLTTEQFSLSCNGEQAYSFVPTASEPQRKFVKIYGRDGGSILIFKGPTQGSGARISNIQVHPL